MSCAATAPARLPGDTARLGWLILLPLGVLVVAQTLLAKAAGFDPTMLTDTDAYMRLTRVIALENGGSWFDPREARIGPPGGHVQHWSRPLDLLLWLPARLLAPVLGFDRALLIVGQLFSPIMLALAVLALEWATRPLLGRPARFMACLLLLLQPAVLAYGGLGRADHHSLLLLLFMTMLGLVIRALGDRPTRRPAVLAGMTAGLALWISSEALIFIAAFLLALGLPWLAGERRLIRTNRDHALATTLTLALALLIERGGHDPLAAEADRLSVVHLVLFAAITLFWSLVGRLPERATGSTAARFMLGSAGAALSALAMVTLFPELRHGILGEVDPLYAELRISRILEVQPPVRPEWLADGAYGIALNRLLFWGGLGLIAIPFLARLLHAADPEIRWRWLPVATALALTLPLTFYQLRWGTYAQSLLVIPYAAALGRAIAGLERHLPPGRLVLVRPVLTATGVLWVHAAVLALPAPPEVETAGRGCPLARLAPVLNDLSAEPRTIMAIADIGSELLFRTHHAVLSIPNHRPQPGFAATARSLASRSPARALEILAAHGVDWVLLCGSGPEAAFVEAASRHREPTLYDRLIAGTPPAGFRAVPLPGFEDTTARLYAPLD